MYEEHVQQLIDSIEYYDETDKPPFYILWYLNGEDFDVPDQYFAVMAVKMKPNKFDMELIKRQSKDEIGNIIYGADYFILKKDDAVDHLENLID